jgi:hypothetical protein
MKNRLTRIVLAAGVLLLAAAAFLPGLRHHKASAQQAFAGGTYSFSAQQPISTATLAGSATMGVLNFDGSGNATGSYLFVLSGSPQVQTVSGQFGGTYVINADGTGTVSLQSPDGALQLTMAIALTDGGNGFYLAITSGTGGLLVTGTARKQ